MGSTTRSRAMTATDLVRNLGLMLSLAAPFVLAGEGSGCVDNDPRVKIALPPSSSYNDQGPADPTQSMRGLIGIGLRSSSQLDSTIDAMYDPSSSTFHQFMAVGDFMTQFGPLDTDVTAVTAFLTSKGFMVLRTATNKMLVEFSGSVDAFNKAFSTTLHTYMQTGDASSLTILFGAPDDVLIPSDLTNVRATVLTADLPVDTTALSPDTTTIDPTPPPANVVGDGFVPAQITKAYGFDALAAAGGTGNGLSLGLVVAYDYVTGDAASFWRAFGLTRKLPIRKLLAEPPATRVTETGLDVEWAGMLAPNADIIVYQVPDIRDTSLLYGWNEAIGLGETTAISNSFGHRESSLAQSVANAYNDASKMAAAIGITVVSATGDTGGVDSPAACPYVTAVGGTNLSLTSDGNVASETAWFSGGAGPSKYFGEPSYQQGVPGAGGSRLIADVSLNGQAFYQTKLLGAWAQHGGTSFASPIFAAMVVDAVSFRKAHGKGALGYLNRALYDTNQTSGVYRDVTVGALRHLRRDARMGRRNGLGRTERLGLRYAPSVTRTPSKMRSVALTDPAQ